MFVDVRERRYNRIKPPQFKCGTLRSCFVVCEEKSEKMEESAMEPDSVEMSGSGPNSGVAEAWETVTAALVSGFPLWTPAAK